MWLFVAAQCSLKYFRVCCHHFKATTKDNCGNLLSKKFSRANLFVNNNNNIGNINLADTSSAKQHICVKLRVRVGSEVSGHQERLGRPSHVRDSQGRPATTKLSGTSRWRPSRGLSGQRRDSCLSGDACWPSLRSERCWRGLNPFSIPASSTLHQTGPHQIRGVATPALLQLKAPLPGYFLPFTVSLWHKRDGVATPWSQPMRVDQATVDSAVQAGEDLCGC